VVRAQVCPAPAVIALAPLFKPLTATGVALLVVVPFPSSPDSLSPQHSTAPPVVGAHVCAAPAPTEAINGAVAPTDGIPNARKHPVKPTRPVSPRSTALLDARTLPELPAALLSSPATVTASARRVSDRREDVSSRYSATPPSALSSDETECSP